MMQSMTTVYITTIRSAGNVKFHSNPDCLALRVNKTKIERSGNVVHPTELEELPLSLRKPCRRCYPDAPKILEVNRQRCTICKQRNPLPCAHNGGVKVRVHRVGGMRSGPKGRYFDPERKVEVDRYVWPENAPLYDRPDGEVVEADR